MLTLFHGDDISFRSVMSDIFLSSKKVNDKTQRVKVVIPMLHSNYSGDNLKLIALLKTFKDSNIFEYDKITFRFVSDFEPDEDLDSYESFEYMYQYLNHNGKFMVYYKVMKNI